VEGAILERCTAAPDHHVEKGRQDGGGGSG
jgi:hypothetical protein